MHLKCRELSCVDGSDRKARYWKLDAIGTSSRASHSTILLLGIEPNILVTIEAIRASSTKMLCSGMVPVQCPNSAFPYSFVSNKIEEESLR